MEDAPLRAELARRQSNAAEVLALFKGRPNEWIDWTEIAKVGGVLAWRTRVSDARKIVEADGGVIQNRQRREAGRVISEYRYLVQAPHGRDAGTVVAAGWSGKHRRPFEEDFRLT